MMKRRRPVDSEDFSDAIYISPSPPIAAPRIATRAPRPSSARDQRIVEEVEYDDFKYPSMRQRTVYEGRFTEEEYAQDEEFDRLVEEHSMLTRNFRALAAENADLQEDNEALRFALEEAKEQLAASEKDLEQHQQIISEQENTIMKQTALISQQRETIQGNRQLLQEKTLAIRDLQMIKDQQQQEILSLHDKLASILQDLDAGVALADRTRLALSDITVQVQSVGRFHQI